MMNLKRLEEPTHPITIRISNHFQISNKETCKKGEKEREDKTLRRLTHTYEQLELLQSTQRLITK